MRHRCYQLARKHQSAFIQLFIQCTVDLACQRNAVRPGNTRVPDSVLERMSSLFEAPEPDRFSWEANTFVLCGNSDVHASR